MSRTTQQEQEEWKAIVISRMKPLKTIKIVKGDWDKGYKGTEKLDQAIPLKMFHMDRIGNFTKTKSVYELSKVIFDVFEELNAKNVNPAKIKEYALTFSFLCFTSVAVHMEEIRKGTNLSKKYGESLAYKWGEQFHKLSKSV